MKLKKEGKSYIGKLILGLFILFFLVQIVLAIETEIKVKTMPNHEVQLTTSKANIADFSVIESFKNNSDEYGDLTFISYCNDPEINIVVYIKKDNIKIMGPERFLNKHTGEPIYLEIAPAWFEFIETPANETDILENQTIENLTTNETVGGLEESEKEEGKISQTGSAVSEEETSSSKKIIFYFIGIIILLIGGLVIFGIMRKSKLTKRGDKKTEETEDAEEIIEEIEKKEEDDDKKKKIIEDAEKKMKELEGDIEELKGKGDKD